ncbi:MAG: HEAT repeat domain-containing protein [Oligoflexia bacterium]|nr:HEAT repeat domain-containing protein [Oligoflexia bacterium]
MQINDYIKQLNTSSDKAAEKVIQKIIEKGKPAVPKLIVAAKESASPRIQKWSLQALGAIGDKRAKPVLKHALSDSRMTVRLHALRGLARMKDSKSSSSIINLLTDESGGIRVNALQALIEIDHCSRKIAIIPLLSDSQWYVRQQACICCKKFQIKNAKSVLKTLAKKDSKKAVRKAAKERLKVFKIQLTEVTLL